MATTPYAVAADVTAYMAAGTVPAEPDLDRLILRAIDAVDDYLVGVQYDVDTNGNPTDTTGVVQAALKQAVCAQVEWWTATGDELGESDQWQSSTVEGAQLNRGGYRPHRLAPRAKAALRVAGLKSTLFPVHLP